MTSTEAQSVSAEVKTIKGFDAVLKDVPMNELLLDSPLAITQRTGIRFEVITQAQNYAIASSMKPLSWMAADKTDLKLDPDQKEHELQDSPRSNKEIHEFLRNAYLLKTGLEELDEVLAGGLRADEVTEFRSPQGTGKSQLCLWLAAQILVANDAESTATCRHNVILITGEVTVGLSRLMSFVRTLRPEWDEQTVESSLAHLVIHRVSSGRELLACLEKIKAKIRNASSADHFPLLIIDGITHIIYPTYYFTWRQLHSGLLATAADRSYAQKYSHHHVADFIRLIRQMMAIESDRIQCKPSDQGQSASKMSIFLTAMDAYSPAGFQWDSRGSDVMIKGVTIPQMDYLSNTYKSSLLVYVRKSSHASTPETDQFIFPLFNKPDKLIIGKCVPQYGSAESETIHTQLTQVANRLEATQRRFLSSQDSAYADLQDIDLSEDLIYVTQQAATQFRNATQYLSQSAWEGPFGVDVANGDQDTVQSQHVATQSTYYADSQPTNGTQDSEIPSQENTQDFVSDLGSDFGSSELY